MVKNPPANARDTRDEVSIPGQEDPLEKEMATHSSVLPEKFLGQRSLVGYSPWGHKESDMTEPVSTHTLNNCLRFGSHAILDVILE